MNDASYWFIVFYIHNCLVSSMFAVFYLEYKTIFLDCPSYLATTSRPSPPFLNEIYSCSLYIFISDSGR